MSIIVQKFGGTSVASSEKIFNAARRAIAAKESGHQVVVVVSARGKKTDELVSLAAEMTDTPSAREMDVLLSTGEQETISLTSMAIHSLGEKAISLTGLQMGIETDSAHTKARIRKISTTRLHQLLDDGQIVLAAGFQGVDEQGDITTLGRGGSDTTATALAAVLNASLCEIYTDVDGIYTTDPRIVPEARQIPQISYDEMLELASLGAGVMHSRSIEFAKKYQVPLRVRSATGEGLGTLITSDSHSDNQVVSGVALVKGEVRVSLVNIPDEPGIMSQIFTKMAAYKIPIDLVVQDIGHDGTAEISFTIPSDDFEDTITAAEEAVKEIGQGEISLGTKLAKVSVVGAGMQSHSGVAAQMFRALAEQDTNILMISTSEIKISVLVEMDDALKAVQAAHAVFQLDQEVSTQPDIGFSQTASDQAIVPDQMKEQDVILKLANMEDIVVSEILVDSTQARITIKNIPDHPGIASELLTSIAQGGIMVDMIVQNVSHTGLTNLSVTIPEQDVNQALLLIREIVEPWGNVSLVHDEQIAKITVAGIGLRSHTGVGEKMFHALAEQKINIQMIGTSEMRMAVVISQDQADKAETILNQTFQL